jgi:hypothetical protein
MAPPIQCQSVGDGPEAELESWECNPMTQNIESVVQNPESCVQLFRTPTDVRLSPFHLPIIHKIKIHVRGKINE